MNPGVAEEVGKATGTFMEIMKTQPLALALCAMNIVLLALFFYVIQTATAVRTREMDRVFEAQEKTNQLLFNCIPAGGRGGSGFKLQSDDETVRIVPLPPLPAEKETSGEKNADRN